MATVPDTLPSSGRTVPHSLKQQVATFSEQNRLEQHARELRREHHRAEQRNESHTPAMRIGAWEKLHGLKLPSEAGHPILPIIANETRLSMAEIRGEQRARAALFRPPSDEGALDLTVYVSA